MKILFTGASSFTGYWFVQSLAAAGHEVICPVTRDLADYADMRRTRLEKLKPSCRLVANAPFGSDNFLKMAAAESFDLLCHHAAIVTGYRSPDFDVQGALKNNTHNLPALLKATRLCGVVLSGSYFEPDEGAGTEPLRAFSPYGLSKALTFQFFQRACHEAGLPLGKFVLPNPFGPFEEEQRFTAHLMRSWQAGNVAEVRTPDYVRDTIHVDLLAATYVKFAAQVIAAKTPLLKTNPSGYAGRQADFAQYAACEVKARTGWACELRLAQQTDFREPLSRTNTESAEKLVPGWSEARAWDAFVDFYTALPRHEAA
jgi:UDP-glucose 4-epimerase